MQDKVGVEIRPGAFVLYAVRIGDVAHLNIGRVQAIKGDKIKVLGVEDYLYRYNYPLKLKQRAGYLEHPDRVVVLGNVPKEYYELLSGVECTGL